MKRYNGLKMKASEMKVGYIAIVESGDIVCTNGSTIMLVRPIDPSPKKEMTFVTLSYGANCGDLIPQVPSVWKVKRKKAKRVWVKLISQL